MSDGKSKYSGLRSEIRQEQGQAKSSEAAVLLVPIKPPAPAGKRSDPAYTQKGSFLKKETISAANERLGRRGDKTDFSDLLQALLEAWLATPE